MAKKKKAAKMTEGGPPTSEDSARTTSIDIPNAPTLWAVVNEFRVPVAVFDDEDRAIKYAKQIGGGVSAALTLNPEADA